MGGLFGGSKSKSYNQAFETLNTALSPTLGNIQEGFGGLSALLRGDSSGFDNFKKATGFDGLIEEGSRGITGNAAAGGMLRSGGTQKALSNYAGTMQNQYADKYMENLYKQIQGGLGAGGLLAQAGQVSKSKSKGGIGGFLGSVAGGIAASDRRLKDNITKIGELSDGLGVYRFTYLGTNAPIIGTMADEVKELRPSALGPTVDGYMTVDYDKLGGTHESWQSS